MRPTTAHSCSNTRSRTRSSQEEQDLQQPWGAQLPPEKHPDNFRIFGLNIGGFSNQNPDKFNFLHSFISTYDPDVMCINETSLLWHKLREDLRLDQRVREWWQGAKCVCSYNRTFDTATDTLKGGTAIIIRGNKANSVVQSGRDPSGLGRWTWVRIQGFGGKTLLIISAYRPVHNPIDDNSAYSQHASFFANSDPIRTDDPRDAILTDLINDISRFHDKGDQILMYMDANEPKLISPKNPVELALAVFPLTEMILAQHDRSNAPRTYEGGSKPIDGLFSTPLLASFPCGYLPFDVSPGDHRVLWVEVPYISVFGEKPGPQRQPASMKRLKCKDPRTVKKFHKFLLPALKKHRAAERAVALERETQDQIPLTPSQQTEWEAIDFIRTTSYLSAEKKCRRLNTGAVCWTPQYQRCVSQHRFWHLLVKRLEGKRVGFRHLARWAQRAGLMSELHAPLEYAIEQKDAAWEALKTIRKKSYSARMGWLADLAASRAEAGLESARKGLEVMRTRERQRRNARIIKSALGNTTRQSLKEVKAPHLGYWRDGEWIGTWKTAVVKEDIEKAGLNETHRRFHQADHTQLLQRPVMDLTGPFGCSETCDEVLLRGDVSSFAPYVDTTTLAYLEQHYTPNLRSSRGIFSMRITTQQHIYGWLGAKEDTSSGPSGLGFSHFIANARDEYTATLDACMTSIPATTGYSPIRWRNGLNVLIPKKGKDTHVDKLRTILLYEADFNMMNKLLGKRMMQCAEFNDRLALEQYGSRKGHSSADQSLNKRLTFDFIRQTLLRCGLISNDAKSCYDRIIHAAAGLSMQRAGAPKSAIIAMFDTIQNLRHYIRTVHGDSTIYLDSAAEEKPIQGVGQGNGAGPAIWGVVSTPIFDSMRRRGYGIVIQNSMDPESFLFVGYAFVDDTDLVISDDPTKPTPPSLFDRIQESVTYWEASIAASGGAIAHEKCFWYNLDFRWKQGKWEMIQPQDSDPPLLVRDPYGNSKPIRQFPPDKGDLTLGVKIAPDGNNVDEVAFLTDKVKTWTERIRAARLPRQLVWQSMTTGIFRSLIYPLVATTMSETECYKLLTPILQTGLPRSGIDRSMPRSIIHAPLSHGGLALPNLFVEQGAAHLSRLTRFGNSRKHITGYLLRAGLQNLTLELGLGGHPFDHVFQEWRTCVTQCWLTCSWKFQSKFNIHVDVDTPTMPLQRHGDQYLMRLFADFGYSPHQLSLLNYCRKFLKVVSISDITDVTGTKLLPFAWDATSESTARGHYRWTKSPPKRCLQWDLWQTALQQVLGLHSRFHYLAVPLGSWYLHFTGPSFYYSPSTGRLLFHQQADSWSSHSPLQSRTARSRFALLATETGPDELRKTYEPLFRADITMSRGYLVSTSQLDHPSSFTAPANDSDESSLGWCAGTWFVPPTLKALSTLRHAIESGSFEAVSDGSFENSAGTAAWCASTTGELELISAGLRVPGHADEQSAYRSEMAGVFAIIKFIFFMVQEFRIHTGAVTIGCDGLSPLLRISNDSKRAAMTDSDWDLLSGIQSMMGKMHFIQWNWIHVRGHQDEKFFGPFDIWTTRNINMDLRASWVWDRVPPLPSNTTIPLAYWPLALGDNQIVSSLNDRVREHCLSPAAEAYWVTKNKLDRTPATHVYWEALGTALQESKLSRRHWTVKHATGRCAVGRRMLFRKEWAHSRCPRCGEPNETPAHVNKCTFPDANTLWTDSLANFGAWLKTQGTHPHIQAIILLRLAQWHNDEELSEFYSNVPGLTEAVRDQDAMGWESATEGRWAIHWITVQNAYFKWKGRRNSGKRWLVAIIKRLWAISWDMWDHRNRVRLAEEEREAIDRARRAITAQFLAGTRDLLLTDQHLLTSKTMRARIAAPLFRQQSWLRRIQGCRRTGELLRFQRQRARSQSLLQRWLDGN